MSDKSEFIAIRSQDEVRVFVDDEGMVCIERDAHEWERQMSLDILSIYFDPANADRLCKAIMAAAAEVRQES